MKKYQINPFQLVSLSKATIDFFRDMNQSIKYNDESQAEATQMHFVADLLKDLVNTAYPIETEPAKTKQPNNNFVTESEKKKVKKLAYKKFIDLMERGNFPKMLIPTFEEWEKGVEIIEY